MDIKQFRQFVLLAYNIIYGPLISALFESKPRMGVREVSE